MRFRKLLYLALTGIVSISAAVLYAQSGGDTSGQSSQGWWNRRLPMAKPVKPATRMSRQRFEVAGRSPEAVAQEYLERNWEWLIGVDSSDRSHGMSYSYTKTSQGFRRDNSAVPAVEFQQLYHGVPVYGGEFGIGVPTNLLDPYPEFGGRVFNIRDLSATPTLSREGAVAALKRAIAPDSIYSTELVDSVAYSPQNMPSVRERMRKMTGRLFVYPSDPPRLVYQISTQVWAQSSFCTGFTFYIDAHSGELLQSYHLAPDFDPEDYFGPNQIPSPKRSDSASSSRVLPAPLEIRRGTFPDSTLERMDRERDSLDHSRPQGSYPPNRHKADKAGRNAPRLAAGVQSPTAFAWVHSAYFTEDEDRDGDGWTARAFVDWDIDTGSDSLLIRVLVFGRDEYSNVALLGQQGWGYWIYDNQEDDPAEAWAEVKVPHSGFWDLRLAIVLHTTGDTIGTLEYGESADTGPLPLDNLMEPRSEDRVFINLTNDPPGIVLEPDSTDADGYRRACLLLNKIRVDYDSTYTIRTRIYASSGSGGDLIFESVPFEITYLNNDIFWHDFGVLNDSVWYGAHGLWDFRMDIVGAGGHVLSYADFGDATNWTDVHLERWNEDPRRTTAFLPNPIHTLNDATLWDQDDVNYAVPQVAYRNVALSNLDAPIGGVYWLTGSIVEIEDFEEPSIAPPNSSDGKFPCFRDDDGFEAVTCYHIIDRCKTYLNSLGFTSTVGYTIHVDPHGFSGADNSRFEPDQSQLGVGQIAMGDGGTDHGEDGDIILHEYGHAIVEYQTGGRFRNSPNEAQAMNSGFSDYWACSWADSMYPTNFGSYFLGEWGARDDDFSPSFIRRTNTLKTYPSFMEGDAHADGEIWSHALWDIMGSLGKRVTDSLALRALELMNASPYVNDPSFATSAQYIAKADALGYNLAHLQQIGQAFEDRGICLCYCRQDPVCDGATNVQDVVGFVNVAFRGDPAVQDNGCGISRTDADASGFTNVQDVVAVVNVAFRGVPPEVQFTNPCY